MFVFCSVLPMVFESSRGYMAGSAVSTMYGMKFTFHRGLDSSFMTLWGLKLARLKNLPLFGNLEESSTTGDIKEQLHAIYGAHIISCCTRWPV